MSEKGQGDGSTEEGTGTGIGVDGTASGGGSAAEQSGSHEGDTQTRGRGSWSTPDPDIDHGKPEIPAMPEDAAAAADPTFPGGGPTDTRAGWDHPSGEGPRGDPPEEPEPEEPNETPEQKAQRQAAEQERHQRAYDDAMTRRAEAEARKSGQTGALPPDLSAPEGALEEGPESVNKYNDNKPVIT